MAKTTNAIRRRIESRQQAQRLSPEELDELLDEAPPSSAGESEPPKPAAPVEIRIEQVTLEAPLAQFRPDVRQFNHVEARLDPAQAASLRRLYDALDRRHARMANGKHVASAADCVRWLLDQLDR